MIVETPGGSASKFKYDEDLAAVTLSRPLPGGLSYPHDWGFVPSTRAEDGDPLDALILWEGASYPGVVLRCRVIGALKVEQNNKDSGARERNDRLLVVPVASRTMQPVASVFDLPHGRREELESFFAASVAFEHKDLTILGWTGPDQAITLLDTAIACYERERRGARPT